MTIMTQTAAAGAAGLAGRSQLGSATTGLSVLDLDGRAGPKGVLEAINIVTHAAAELIALSCAHCVGSE
jgi:hypothetical protein